MNALDDFCLWAPPANTSSYGDSSIANTERIEVAWCLRVSTSYSSCRFTYSIEPVYQPTNVYLSPPRIPYHHISPHSFATLSRFNHLRTKSTNETLNRVDMEPASCHPGASQAHTSSKRLITFRLQERATLPISIYQRVTKAVNLILTYVLFYHSILYSSLSYVSSSCHVLFSLTLHSSLFKPSSRPSLISYDVTN